jgi:hypothetical protein
MGKRTTLNISEKKEVCACTYNFPVTFQQNTVIHFWYYEKNSSIDAVLVKYLVKSVYEKSLASASTIRQMCQVQKTGRSSGNTRRSVTCAIARFAYILILSRTVNTCPALGKVILPIYFIPPSPVPTLVPVRPKHMFSH